MNDPGELPEDVEPLLESSQEEVRVAAVPVALHGQRLDRVLAQLVPEFSRSYLQQLIEQGEALIDGRVTTKVSAKVRLGHQLQITLRATPQSQAFVPEAMPIEVVYEDEHLRVIHKPAGLVVHPAPGNWRGTLLNGLLALDPKASEVPRAGIVHRLDKDTSGLMVVARTRQAMDALVSQIVAREVHRHADVGLAARFRQRFAFAPDALAAHAYRAGQPAGPLLLLDDDRAVVRVAQGGPHGPHQLWHPVIANQDLMLGPLPNHLQGQEQQHQKGQSRPKGRRLGRCRNGHSCAPCL